MFQNKVSHIFFICQCSKNMFRIRGWHLILSGARPEAHSRRSRGLPRGSQGKRDPLFAINLSSLVGVRLDDSALLGSEECRLALASTQGPEEMCLSLEHQNPSKTSEKMGYFDRVHRVTVSLHILSNRKPRD